MKSTNPLKAMLTLGGMSLLILASQLSCAALLQPSGVSRPSQPQQLAVGLGDLADLLRRPRVPGGSRGDGDEDATEICAIVPGRLEIGDETTTIKVWSLDPVFVWQDGFSKLEVIQFRTNTLVASADLAPGQRHLLYSDIANAQPLQPGQAYYWRLSNDETFAETSFRMMNETERADVEAALEAESLNGQNPTDDIMQARIDFFLTEGLWADAFREIYAERNPSEAILSLRASIEANDYCPPEVE